MLFNFNGASAPIGAEARLHSYQDLHSKASD